MNKQDILTLYQYNRWANEKILTAAARVSADQFLAEADFPHGGLRGTLTHLLFAEWIWRNRWEGISPTARFGPEDFPDFDALQARWQQEQAALMRFVETLREEQLDRPFAYRTTRGEPQQRILWQAMLHVVNHGTQHRAEAAAILTACGCSPGDLDLVYFLGD